MPISRRYRSNDLKGRLASTDTQIKTRFGKSLEPGALVTIKNVVRGKGLTVKTVPCDCCGQSTYITGVSRDELSLVETENSHSSAPITLRHALGLIATDPSQYIRDIVLSNLTHDDKLVFSPGKLRKLVDPDAVKVAKIIPSACTGYGGDKSIRLTLEIFVNPGQVYLNMPGTDIHYPQCRDMVCIERDGKEHRYRLAFAYGPNLNRPDEIMLQAVDTEHDKDLFFKDLTPEEKSSIYRPNALLI